MNVGQVAALDRLGLEFLGGVDGHDRLITWAHTIELADPWRWVSPGDLVMTTGAGLPSQPRDQAQWIDRLADAQASALVVAPRSDAPPITRAMRRRADALRFPLLGASFDLRFSELARVVIGSSLRAQRERLDASERLFESYTDSLRQSADFPGRLQILARRLGWHIDVVDVRTGEPIAASFRRWRALPDPVEMRVPGRAGGTLRVWSRNAEEVIDPLQVHYLTGLVAIELESQAIERDHRRLDGVAVLEGLMAGRVDYGAARAYLQARGLTPENCVVVASVPGDAGDRGLEDAHLATALRSLDPLMRVDGDVLLSVLPDDRTLVDAFTAGLGVGARSGMSGALSATTAFGTSVHQARLALARAQGAVEAVVEYAALQPADVLMPRSFPDAQRLVERYLGPLVEYDARRGSNLLATLRAFLACDGNWGATASSLQIHRQTLVYRLRRVEELTGMRATSTAGTAAFWLALEAGQAAGLLAVPGGGEPVPCPGSAVQERLVRRSRQ